MILNIKELPKLWIRSLFIYECMVYTVYPYQQKEIAASAQIIEPSI